MMWLVAGDSNGQNDWQTILIIIINTNGVKYGSKCVFVRLTPTVDNIHNSKGDGSTHPAYSATSSGNGGVTGLWSPLVDYPI